MRKLIFIVAITILVSCKKEATQTNTPYTVNGTFSFTFNGNNVDVNGNQTNGTTKACELIQSNGETYLYLVGDRVKSILPELIFEAYIKMPNSIIQAGTYTTLASNNYITIKSQNDSRCACYDTYTSSTNNVISFTITSYNQNTKEVSCIFSGKVQKQNTSTTATIGSGRINGNLK